jgi:hypothetical protein
MAEQPLHSRETPWYTQNVDTSNSISSKLNELPILSPASDYCQQFLKKNRVSNDKTSLLRMAPPYDDQRHMMSAPNEATVNGTSGCDMSVKGHRSASSLTQRGGNVNIS